MTSEADGSGAAGRLPPAQKRLVEAVRDLHEQAGRPSLRAISKAIRDRDDLPDTISHEVVGQLLRGRTIPRWSKVETLVRYLAGRSLPPRNAERESVRFLTLWREAQDGVSGDAQEASPTSDSAIDLTEFTNRHNELKSKAQNNAIEMEATLAAFTFGASVKDVLVLMAQLGNERASRDRTLFVALIRAFVRGRGLDDVVQLLTEPEISDLSDASGIALESAACRDDIVALISLLRTRNLHKVAFSVLCEVARDYDRIGIIDEEFSRSGNRREAELLRAFRMPYSPFGV